MECPLHQNDNFKVKCKGHNLFSDLIIFKSTFVHDETVDGTTNVIDINSLLYGVV
jgi:hypothetical protein